MSGEPAITLALHRASLYRLLALAFAYPTSPGLEAVATGAWKAAVVAPAELRVVLRRLADAAGGGDEASLGAEHVTLFQRQVRCPPYEGGVGLRPPLVVRPTVTGGTLTVRGNPYRGELRIQGAPGGGLTVSISLVRSDR